MGRSVAKVNEMTHLLVRTSVSVPALLRREYNVLPSNSIGLDDKTRIVLISTEMPYVDISIAGRDSAFGDEVALIEAQVLITSFISHLVVRSLTRLVTVVRVIHKRHFKVVSTIFEPLRVGHWTNKLVLPFLVQYSHTRLGTIAKVPFANLLIFLASKSLSFLSQPLLFCQQPLFLSSQSRHLFHKSFLSSGHDQKRMNEG